MSPFVTSVPRLGTGVIRGRVVATDGRPLPRAQVGLVFTAARLAQDVMRADGGGAFEFRGLSPGTYRIVASKPGYEPYESTVADAPLLGRRILLSGRSVTLAAGEAIDPIDVPLAPLATLSGVVLDDNGDPLQGASVQLLTIRYEAGRRQLVSAEVAARVTDDVGRYRLFGIAPGQMPRRSAQRSAASRPRTCPASCARISRPRRIRSVPSPWPCVDPRRWRALTSPW